MSLYLPRHINHFDGFMARVTRRNVFPFDSGVTVEIYPGVPLDGHIHCDIDAYRIITAHRLTVRDKDGKDCKVDWDDLADDVQDAIEEQVMDQFDKRSES